MIVIDASALAEFLTVGPLGRRVGALVRDLSVMHAPAIIDLEVTQAVRALRRSGQLSDMEARDALDDLERSRLVRHGHVWMLSRVWTWRDRCSAYDAAYVVLAERLGLPLLTLDGRLARGVADVVDVRLVA